jgi:Fic family protein
MTTQWIWQQPDWPDFNWQAERLAPLLRECVQAQGQLMGMAGSAGNSLSAQTELDALLQNIVTSSAIEGEQLNVGQCVRHWLDAWGWNCLTAIKSANAAKASRNLMLDATRRFAEPLTLERLLEWHRWLFPDQESDFTARSMHVGALRGDEPMQVVSGRLDRPTVHFEAPPRRLERQLDRFLPGSSQPASNSAGSVAAGRHRAFLVCHAASV